MRLITEADDELYGLSSAAGKLGPATKLLARLADAAKSAPTDVEAATRSALAQMAVLPGISNDFAAHARLTATVEALGEVLALEPDHWLARYSRVRLQALLPNRYGAAHIHSSGELGTAREDLAYLVALQAGAPPQPYFLSTYALATVIEHLAGGPVSPTLNDLLSTWPRTPVRLPALGAVLCEPLATLYARSAEPSRTVLGEVMASQYGGQAAVTAVRMQPGRG